MHTLQRILFSRNEGPPQCDLKPLGALWACVEIQGDLELGFPVQTAAECQHSLDTLSNLLAALTECRARLRPD